MSLSAVGTAMRTSHHEHCPELGPICETDPDAAQEHTQEILLGEARLRVEWPLADAWAVALMAPMRIVDTTVEIENADGTPLPVGYEDIHHRNETLVGPGDLWLTARHAPRLGAWTLDATAGVTIPVGRTEGNPYSAGERGEEHEHMQFGTGAFDPIAGLRIERGFGGFSAAVWGLGIVPVYENGQGYRAGRRFFAGLTGVAAVGSALRVHLGPEIVRETPEEWDGQVPSGEGNRGRTDLFAAGGASLAFADGWSVSATARVPVYTHVVGGQLSYPVLGEATLSHTIELAEHDHGHGDEGHVHAHGHGEGAAADFTGLDVVEIAPNGEAVDLVPVAGKITVFDFWATWCVPCRELDRQLAALMRDHPDRIAVRKVHVEQWDTPAARRYLGDAPALPHVVVVTPDGERFERSGDPEAIVAAIRDLALQ